MRADDEEVFRQNMFKVKHQAGLVYDKDVDGNGHYHNGEKMASLWEWRDSVSEKVGWSNPSLDKSLVDKKNIHLALKDFLGFRKFSWVNMFICTFKSLLH